MVGKDLIMATLFGSGGSSGSGGGEGESLLLPFDGYTGISASGTFTTAEHVTYHVEVEHNLGKTPVGCLLVHESERNTSVAYKAIVFLYCSPTRYLRAVKKASSGTEATVVSSNTGADLTTAGSVTDVNLAYNADPAFITFGTTKALMESSQEYNTALMAGTYHWIVW